MKRNFGIGADSPMKETTMPTRTGAVINPALSYEYKSAKIPSFRDMVSLEQQQDARKAWKAGKSKRKDKRIGKKLDRQMRRDLKEESTPEAIGKRRDEMYNIVQEQQRKVLESQRQMEEEGRRLSPDPLGPDAITLQPLTLPEIEEKKKERKKNVNLVGKEKTNKKLTLEQRKKIKDIAKQTLDIQIKHIKNFMKINDRNLSLKVWGKLDAQLEELQKARNNIQ
jgi:hypothetical protein